jgi:hypothetical protein
VPALTGSSGAGVNLPGLARLALEAAGSWADLWATTGLHGRKGRGISAGSVAWVAAQGHIGNRNFFF